MHAHTQSVSSFNTDLQKPVLNNDLTVTNSNLEHAQCLEEHTKAVEAVVAEDLDVVQADTTTDAKAMVDVVHHMIKEIIIAIVPLPMLKQ